MREVEFWKWFTPGIGGKVSASRYEMTVEDAQARFPGCKPVPGSRLVRMLPESPGEVALHRCGSDGVGGPG